MMSALLPARQCGLALLSVPLRSVHQAYGVQQRSGYGWPNETWKRLPGARSVH